jgi:hypothetical protein
MPWLHGNIMGKAPLTGEVWINFMGVLRNGGISKLPCLITRA